MLDHLVLTVTDPARSRAFYERTLAPLGYAPGIREIYHPNYYGAFVFDPDGSNIEAVCHLEQGIVTNAREIVDRLLEEGEGDFDVTRSPNHHVGFGGGGPHYCLGASFARTQLRAIFSELLTRAPGLEVGEPEPLVGNFIDGVKRLPYSVTA